MLQGKKCVVEIISIGNELLLGNTINTNSSWIAAKVTAEGAHVTRIITVGDELGEIVKTVRDSLRRKPNYIITTGGIGPTFDDMTVRAIASALRQRMKVDPAALAMIKEKYSRRYPDKKLKLTRSRLKMAMIPTRGIAVLNPVGTAPAVKVVQGKTEIFILPGVPDEMHAIFRITLAEAIRRKVSSTVFMEQWATVDGIMESTLAPLIDQTMRRWPNVYIKSHARGFEGRGVPHLGLHFSGFSNDSERIKHEMTVSMDFLVRKLRGLNVRVIIGK